MIWKLYAKANNFSFDKYIYSTTGSPTVTLLRLHHGYGTVYHMDIKIGFSIRRPKRLLSKKNYSAKLYFKATPLPWRDGRCVQGPKTFTVACWSTITNDSSFMQGELQPAIWTKVAFQRFASVFTFATF